MLIPARLSFSADGTPYSETFDDVYHSSHGGPAQARHVFLGGNDLPVRWQGQERFVILETGFGLGLNFLATWQAWENDPARSGRLHFISVEKHPFLAEDLAIAHRAWPEFADLSAELLAQWPPLVSGFHRLLLAGGRLTLTLIFGDATTELRAVDAAVDAFFLDGFSPARNPELWTPNIAKALARLAAPDATLATWSVAGHVREALQVAEFNLEKRPGFTGKKQMLTGRFRSRRPLRQAPPTSRQAIVLGAGIAGSTVALALAVRDWQVTVLEQNAQAGEAASGNLAGVLRPLPSADDNRLSRLTRAGFLTTCALLNRTAGARWDACGVLHLARDATHEQQQRRAVDTLGWPETLLQFLDAEAASQKLGYPVQIGGWWFPQGGWVQPPSLCRAALAAGGSAIDFRPNTQVDRITFSNGEWQCFAADGRLIASAPTLILACGAALGHFPEFDWIPQVSARGQVSHLPADRVPALPSVVCRHGYLAPAVDGLALTGATLQPRDEDTEEREADHQENLDRLERSLPGFTGELSAANLAGKVGFRPMSPDRLPIVGHIPYPEKAARLPQLKRQPGLWCALGYGARGIVWSALMADLLASQLEGEPLPLARDLVDAVDPGRFLLR